MHWLRSICEYERDAAFFFTSSAFQLLLCACVFWVGWSKCGTLYMCVPLLAVLVLLLQAAFKEGRCSFGKQGKALRPHGYPTDTQIRHDRKKQ